MMGSHFDVPATPAYAAAALRQLFFGPVAWIVYVVIFVAIILFDIHVDAVRPFVLSSFVIGLFLWMMHRFIIERLENTTVTGEEHNVARLLAPDIVGVLAAYKEEVTSYGVLECALLTERGKMFMEEMGVSHTAILARARHALEGVTAESFAKGAATSLPKLTHNVATAPVIIFLALHMEGMQKVSLEADLSQKDLEQILLWEEFHHDIQLHDRWHTPEGLLRIFGAIGRNWVASYTMLLRPFTVNITEQVAGKHPRKVLLHGDELNALFKTLSTPHKHNALIVGGVGSGRHTLLENAAVFLREHQLKRNSALTKMLNLKTERLLSAGGSPDEKLLHSLDRAGRKERFIFIVEDMGLILRGGDTKLRGVIAEFLRHPNINILGIVTSEDYHTLIKADASLDALFSKITLREVDDDETMAVLMEECEKLKHSVRLTITYKAMRSAVELTRRYVSKGAMPGNAVSVLEEAIILAKNYRDPAVTEAHVREVLSARTNIELSQLTKEGKEKLRSIEKIMQKTIVGQEKAVVAVASTLRRARLDITDPTRPLGTFLFLGPTGVGKTQTAKALARAYFSSEARMIRVDMNDFGTEQGVPAIIGSPGGKEGYLTKLVQDQPFSVVLLDEIEKAHPSVRNLFLQILDEGELMDGHGRKTNFRNTIIIATSNAGANLIREAVRSGEIRDIEKFEATLIDSLVDTHQFSPEFLNRFDDIIVFEPLTLPQAEKIAHMQIDRVVREFTEKRGISVAISDDVVRTIVKQGYSPDFGAREMRRAVMNIIENYLADYLLNNDIKRGGEIVIE